MIDFGGPCGRVVKDQLQRNFKNSWCSVLIEYVQRIILLKTTSKNFLLFESYSDFFMIHTFSH